MRPVAPKDEFKLPVVIAEALARTLSEKIIFLELAPGAHLTEDGVCGEYGVSRSPVREAFRALEAEGLVRRLARRGVRVTPVGRRDVEEVYECRVALEGLAARGAARNATADDVVLLRRLLDDMGRALKKRQVKAFFESNVAFTNAIHVASANATLLRIAAGIEKQALRYRYLAHSHTHAMLEAAYDGHSTILEAVAARKPAAAERAGQQAIRRGLAVILEVIDNIATVDAIAAQ